MNQKLIIACYKVDSDEAVRCLRKGADVNARLGNIDAKDGWFLDRWTGRYWFDSESWTPLLALASADRYPDPPVEFGDIWKDGTRAQAIRESFPKANLEARARDMISILRILISHGCKVDAADRSGATALTMCAIENRLLMAKMLLQFGANPNIRTRIQIDGVDNTTPLHEAFDSPEMIQLLLDHGADASAKDGDGKTPADWVAMRDERTFDLVKTAAGWRVVPRTKAPNPPKTSDE